MADSVFYDEEEEDPILDHRAADVAAEVVETYGTPNPGDAIEPKRSGIQIGVLEIVVCHTVKRVCSALADLVVDNTAGPVLRRKYRIVHLDFGDGVEDRSVNDVIAHGRVGRHAVHQRVGKRHGSIDRHQSHTPAIVVGPRSEEPTS